MKNLEENIDTSPPAGELVCLCVQYFLGHFAPQIWGQMPNPVCGVSEMGPPHPPIFG